MVVAVDRPGRLGPGVRSRRRWPSDHRGWTKTLHLGDPDVTWLVRQPAGPAARGHARRDPGLERAIGFTVRHASEHAEIARRRRLRGRAQRHAGKTPTRSILGRTVYGLADDRPYFPRGETPTEAEATAGADWFVFDFESDLPKLAFFALDFVDRDVPARRPRSIRRQDGKLVEYTRGIDPQSLQRERPPRPGANKFTTRVLTTGPLLRPGRRLPARVHSSAPSSSTSRPT